MTTILFVENGSAGGGSFESLLLIVEHLNRDLFSPVVVFVNETHHTSLLRTAGVPVYILRDPVYSKDAHALHEILCRRVGSVLTRWFPLLGSSIAHAPTIFMLRRIAREHDVSLVHANNQPLRDLHVLMFAVWCRILVISYLRSARTVALDTRIAEWANRVVARFVANSQYAKQHWASLGIASEKIMVVYNAVETAAAVPFDVRDAFGIRKDQVIVCCVGNCIEGKGHNFLLDAFPSVLARVPHAVLLYVGDGPERPALEARVRTLGIDRSVIFAGYDPRARAIIALSTVLVVPSATETFGRTLLEAMEANVPIVATRVGGIPEVVTHEQNGLLVSYGDTTSLANAIIRIIEEPTFARQLAENGRALCRKRFSLGTHIAALTSVYQSVL